MDTPSKIAESEGRRPRVVVVGAGFAGLQVVHTLAKADCEVLLLDRRNYHLFQPLLYQVATAAVSPADIAAPIRSIVRQYGNVNVLLTEVTGVDLARRRVLSSDAEIAYDWLVLAAGSTQAYFGHDEWAGRAPGLKSVDDALEIRRRILLAFEAAELEEDDGARAAMLTFVVVGGGPTGVEMAGALREIATAAIPKDFRRVDTKTTRVLLLEGGPRLLPSMSKRASSLALRQLEEMGVEVRLETFVTDIDDEHVWTGDTELPAGTVVWAAGVRAVPVAAGSGVALDEQGRVIVEPDCSIPGHPRVFAVGDLAAQVSADSGEPVPGVAQGAIQMGAFVGKIIHDEIGSRSRTGSTRRVESSDGARTRPAFRYRDKGEMATIGRARAVADIGGRTFGGFFAWLLWSLVHVAFLVEFRHKLLVMVHWAWQWVVQSRGARLITGSDRPRVEKPVDWSVDSAA